MSTNRLLKATLFLAIIICLLIPLGSAGAANGATLPDFSGFVTSVVDGQANVVRGVYVPEVLALQVLQPLVMYSLNCIFEFGSSPCMIPSSVALNTSHVNGE